MAERRAQSGARLGRRHHPQHRDHDDGNRPGSDLPCRCAGHDGGDDDGQQAIETGYQTDAWGNTLAGSAADNPYLYGGGEGYWQEPTLGLTYVGARWLEPQTGTWLSVDPVVGEPNYSYAYNSPTAYTDPTGMAPQFPDDSEVAYKIHLGQPLAPAEIDIALAMLKNPYARKVFDRFTTNGVLNRAAAEAWIRSQGKRASLAPAKKRVPVPTVARPTHHTHPTHHSHPGAGAHASTHKPAQHHSYVDKVIPRLQDELLPGNDPDIDYGIDWGAGIGAGVATLGAGLLGAAIIAGVVAAAPVEVPAAAIAGAGAAILGVGAFASSYYHRYQEAQDAHMAFDWRTWFWLAQVAGGGCGGREQNVGGVVQLLALDGCVAEHVAAAAQRLLLQWCRRTGYLCAGTNRVQGRNGCRGGRHGGSVCLKYCRSERV